MNFMSIEEMVNHLDQHQDYLVVKRFERVKNYHSPNNENKLIGVFLDTETTGTSYLNDKIIELALVPFEYSRDGKIYNILDTYSEFHDPGISIPKI